MARWVLDCSKCGNEFTVSQITESDWTFRDSFIGFLAKPEFPDGGLIVICPSCKASSICQRYQLLYRAA